MPIWIDAICINQNDIDERNYQVAKMKRIYEQAAEMTVWLGTHHDDSHAAFQCMKDVLIFAQHEHPIWVCIDCPRQASSLLIPRSFKAVF